MPKQIKILPGSTLSGIAKQYGTTTSDLMSLNPDIKDPNKIFAGANLNIPDLAGTLTTGETAPIGTQPLTAVGRELPESNTDKLSIFRNLLKTVSQKAGQESTMAGVGAMGVEPSKVSGGTLSGILGFIRGQKTQGVADIYKSTIDMLDSQQKQAQDQLNLLINTGGITELTDSTLAKLSSSANMDFDLLYSIRKKKQDEAKTPASFTVVEEGNRQVRLGFDKAGNIINKTDIGSVKARTTTVSSTEKLGQYKSEFLAQKSSGMPYEDAINAWGAYLDLNYIKEIYEVKKEKTEKEKAQESMWAKYNELRTTISNQAIGKKPKEGELRTHANGDIEKYTYKGNNKWETYFKKP